MALDLIHSDPPADQVRQVTFVPFLPDGRCVLVEGPADPSLPSGEVLDGEDYLIDTVLRVPLEAAGFRYQRFRPFGQAGQHLYAWIEGAPYAGNRPHASAVLSATTAEDAAARLRVGAKDELADAVMAASASYRTSDDQTYYADSLRTLQRAYLRGRTPQEGSGFGGDEHAWRQARHHISEPITSAGTFLDVGCANGLLMESIARWCAERGLPIEPFGVDLAACARIWVLGPEHGRPPAGPASSPDSLDRYVSLSPGGCSSRHEPFHRRPPTAPR